MKSFIHYDQYEKVISKIFRRLNEIYLQPMREKKNVHYKIQQHNVYAKLETITINVQSDHDWFPNIVKFSYSVKDLLLCRSRCHLTPR